MRFVIAMLATLGLFLGSAAIPATALAAADSGYHLTLDQQQQPGGKLDIDIDVNKGGGGAWWASPVWIAIGVIGVVLLVVIVAMIARGGGTTIVKE